MSAAPAHFFTCEECRDFFPYRRGGVCRTCGRILCDTHLLGPGRWWRRWVIRAPACVACRTRPGTPAPPPAGIGSGR
jgi:hypothetical protein